MPRNLAKFVAAATLAVALVNTQPSAGAATPAGHVPDQYVVCATNEGWSCQCTGVVIFGSPQTNLWSEPAKVDGSIVCDAKNFPKTLPGSNRQCWCKDKSVARKADYPPEAPLKLNNIPYKTTKVDDGLEWRSVDTYEIFGVPQSFDVVLIDTAKHPMTIGYSENGLKKTSAMAAEHGARVGVNGGFHAYGTSVGSVTMLKVDGKEIVKENTQEQWDLQSEDVEGVLCFDAKGVPSIMSAHADPNAWKKCYTYLHTGPLLLLKGVRQPLDHKTWNHVRNPRTAVCTLKNGQAMMLTVDGRHPNAGGMTLPELEQFMQALGCEDAINLDGGGSTTMYIEERGMVNEPRDKPRNGEPFDTNLTERGVSNAILVL